MKTHQYKITFQHPDWFMGNTIDTLTVTAPNKDYAIIQYYQARGRQIAHDTQFISIEEISH